MTWTSCEEFNAPGLWAMILEALKLGFQFIPVVTPYLSLAQARQLAIAICILLYNFIHRLFHVGITYSITYLYTYETSKVAVFSPGPALQNWLFSSICTI